MRAYRRAWPGALAGARATADRDGPLRKPFSERTVAVPTRKAPGVRAFSVHLAFPPGETLIFRRGSGAGRESRCRVLQSLHWKFEQGLQTIFEIVSRAPERARAVLHHDVCALDSSSNSIIPGCCAKIRPRLAAQRERSCLACEAASRGKPHEANGGTHRAHSGLEGTGHTSDPFSGSAFLFFGILSGGGKHLKAIAGRQRGGICCQSRVEFIA